MARKLDIGCGEQPVAGFDGIDIKDGQTAFPLDVKPGSIREIRASHVLEHFSHVQVQEVLSDWVKALEPGGILRIAVPDFELIARAYLDGKSIPVQGYVMGGHVDDHDRHGAIFDTEALIESMQAVGLIGISHWISEQADCAQLPISLNLQGIKPPTKWPKIRAVMSTPRLGWNDMWGCALQSLATIGIPLIKHTGAFWEQCLTRAIKESLQDNPEYILTLDYDSVFTATDIQNLIVSAERVKADAIAALQVHRTRSTPLFTIGDGAGANRQTVEWEMFSDDIVRCRTAHFGLTLLRADKLKSLPQPWFHGNPSEDGSWDEGRTDPDISFWRAWERAGNSLYVANRVPIGHLEVMIRWPNRKMSAIWQHPTEYHAEGKPEDIWR